MKNQKNKFMQKKYIELFLRPYYLKADTAVRVFIFMWAKNRFSKLRTIFLKVVLAHEVDFVSSLMYKTYTFGAQ